MARWSPAPILGGAYTDEAKPWACQDTVNWLPVRIERPNGRSDWKLTPVPGLSVFSAFANATTDANDRVRGLRNVEGALYVVCGQSLFRVNTDGTIETIQENAIPGTGRVTMTHNQETGGYSLVMTNGYGGWTYNSGTSTFAEITDEGFPGFKTCDFLDQYIVGISPDGLFAFHSDLANATEYNTLDRYSAEAAPDRLVGQVADHGQWWLFGERTTEIYTNTGAATGTFQRIPGSTIERGLAGTHAVAKLDNTVFWVGNDGVVYRANGFTPVRISTHPIERELSQCDLSQAFCLVYEDRGHKILYVTCPDGKTWGYDVAAQEWHRRESYNRSNWRITSLARWAGGWVGGDELTNRLQRVAWEYRDEDGSPLIVRRTTGILHGNENRLQLHAIKLVIDSGRIPGDPRPLQNNTYPVEIYNPLSVAYLGAPVDHNYLGRFGVTPYTFAVVAGSLPTGLSMDSAGNLTGTPTATGSFAWRVQITDAIGQTDTLDQGIDLAEGIDGGSEFVIGIEAGYWWLAGADPGKVYVTTTPRDWTSASLVTRSPSIAPDNYGVGGGGYYRLSDTAAVMVNSEGEVERITGLNITDPVTPTISTPLPSGGYRVRIIAGIIFVFTYSGNATYYTSTDGGATWNTRSAPALKCSDIGRINSRWVMFCKDASPHAYYYSDDPSEPTSWTLGSGPNGADGAMISMVGKAMHYVGSGRVNYTTDGATWTQSADIIPDDIGLGCHAYDGGNTVICGDTNASHLYITRDKGDTWTSIPFRNTRRIDVYDGFWVASCPSGTGGIFYSDDAGATWNAATLPPGVTPGVSTTLYATPIGELV